MTVLDALNWANERLKKTGVDSPMLDAQILLAHLLDVKKSWLFSHFNDVLKPHQQEQFHLAVNRRMKREPVAYITGTKPFYGRSFFVNSSVLIPRPATETLIEQAIAHIDKSDAATTLLCDIGTGSGAIAITLALETSLPVIATDVSHEAIVVAKRNAEMLNVTEIDFRAGSLLEPIIDVFETIRQSNDPLVSSVYPFKHLLLCANLPYLSDAQIETLDPDVRHEPVHALRAGIDGLDAYHELVRQLRRYRDVFPRRVTLLIEIDPAQTQKAADLIVHSFPMSEPRVVKDLQGLDRVVITQL